MQVPTTLSALLAVCIAGAAAQTSFSGLPTCAQSCASDSLPSSCSETDYACICGTSSFITDISCCVADSCDTADQETTLEYADALCSAVGVTNLPTAAACTGTTTATATAASGSATTDAASVTTSASAASGTSAASSATSAAASSGSAATSAATSASAASATGSSTASSSASAATTTQTGAAQIVKVDGAAAMGAGAAACLAALYLA